MRAPCTFPECGRPAISKGLCDGHRKQRDAYGIELRPLGLPPPVRPLLVNPDAPGTMLVPLGGGHHAIVDAADAAAVSQKNWHLHSAADKPTKYARASATKTAPTILLHVYLWNLWGLPATPEVDHANTNGLDCRRENLRAATQAQNAHNRRRPRSNTSGTKGVSWHKATGKWRATIGVDGKIRHLGLFSSQAEAAAAYAAAAEELHGAFARTA